MLPTIRPMQSTRILESIPIYAILSIFVEKLSLKLPNKRKPTLFMILFSFIFILSSHMSATILHKLINTNQTINIYFPLINTAIQLPYIYLIPDSIISTFLLSPLSPLPSLPHSFLSLQPFIPLPLTLKNLLPLLTTTLHVSLRLLYCSWFRGEFSSTDFDRWGWIGFLWKILFHKGIFH